MLGKRRWAPFRPGSNVRHPQRVAVVGISCYDVQLKRAVIEMAASWVFPYARYKYGSMRIPAVYKYHPTLAERWRVREFSKCVGVKIGSTRCRPIFTPSDWAGGYAGHVNIVSFQDIQGAAVIMIIAIELYERLYVSRLEIRDRARRNPYDSIDA